MVPGTGPGQLIGPDERGAWAACLLILASPGLSELAGGFVNCQTRDVDWLGLAAEALTWGDRERYLLSAAYQVVTSERHTLAALLNEQLGAPGEPDRRLTLDPAAHRHVSYADRRRLDLARAVRLGRLNVSDALAQLDP